MLMPMKKLVRRYRLRPAGVIHVGAHLAEEREAYESAGVQRVVWIEANPNLIPELTRRAAGRMATRVVQAVLSNRDGETATLHLASNGQSSSILAPARHLAHHPKVTFDQTVALPATTFRTLVAQEQIDLAGYDFLNLDIQGAELLALEGFGDLVRGFRAIYSEVNTGELYRGCARLEELDAWLQERGFRRAATEMTRHEWGDALYLAK